MTLETRAKAIFDALAADDMDELVSHWAEDGIYFNPAVGPPAHGKPLVKETIGKMSTGLQSRAEVLSVDRMTPITEAVPQRLYIEWHVESTPDNPRHGIKGIHVVEFDEAGYFHRVTVFAHSVVK